MVTPLQHSPTPSRSEPTPYAPRTPVPNTSVSSLQSAMQNTSCCQKLCDLLCTPFRLFIIFINWIFSCCASTKHPPSLLTSSPTCIAQTTIDLNAQDARRPPSILDERKMAVYKSLVKGRSLGGPIGFSKFALGTREKVSQMPLFFASPKISAAAGPIRPPASTDNVKQWQANFAHTNIFAFHGGPLLAQEEQLVLHCPPLAHADRALREKGLTSLEKDQAILLTNVSQMGELDTFTPLPNRVFSNGSNTLYGNSFAEASLPDIFSRLTVYPNSQPRNIFSFAAPIIPAKLCNQPYTKQHLADLFYTAYTNFAAIKQSTDKPDQTSVAHTGLWGAGAFGNGEKASLLIQIAAAHAADLDVVFYPLDKFAVYSAALELFNQIKKQNPNMTIQQFLDHVAQYAQHYGLLYGKSNGT